MAGYRLSPLFQPEDKDQFEDVSPKKDGSILKKVLVPGAAPSGRTVPEEGCPTFVQYVGR